MRQDIFQTVSISAMPDHIGQEQASTAISANRCMDCIPGGYASCGHKNLSIDPTADAEQNRDLYRQFQESAQIDYDYPSEPMETVDVGDLPPMRDGLFLNNPAGPAERLQALRDELNAFLDQGICENLDALYLALTKQLSQCQTHHLLRLRLTGFCHKNLASSKPMFQFYINPRHFGEEYAWVQCAADFAWNSSISTAGMTLCKQLGCAEEKRKSLLISINRQQQTFNSDMTSQGDQIAWKYGESIRTPPMHSLPQLIALPSTPRTNPENTIEVDNRDRLCFNMALSAFFLLRTSWKQVPWCNWPKFDANIHFCRDPATGLIQNQTEALLSCPIVLNSPHPESDPNLNCDVNLFELAKLLIVLRFWETPRFLENPGMQSKEESRTGLYRFINSHRELGRRESDFLYAVNACLSPEGQIIKWTKDSFIQYFSAEILQPLASYAGISGIAVEDLKEYIVSATEEKHKPLKKLPHTRIKGPDSSTAKEFMSRMLQFTNKYVGLPKNPSTIPLPKNRDEKIRIAIIDTGVCSSDESIREAKHRIKAKRNFSGSNAEDCEDFHGRGTTVARLVLEVAPEAEVYIAKVTSSKSISDQELCNIYEAINWAVQVWKVDIINFSMAIDGKPIDIDRALNRALVPASTIIFAAAHRNVGQHEGPTWPGTRPGVIAIHCTDGAGKPQGNASVGQENYFATLGCEIPMTECFITSGASTNPKRTEVYATGASYATPIAAGIAANVLEIIRHDAGPEYDDLKRFFYNGHYMKKLFEEMSQRDGRCRFVQPWTFWDNIIMNPGRDYGLNLRLDDKRNIIEVLQRIVSLKAHAKDVWVVLAWDAEHGL